MAVFPAAVASDSDLYIAVNQLSTTLTDNPLAAGAATVNVASTTGFPQLASFLLTQRLFFTLRKLQHPSPAVLGVPTALPTHPTS